MNKQTANNLLVALGLWTFSRVVAGVIKVFVAVVNPHGMTFTGDAGTVTMWLWLRFPDVLAAAVAAIALVSVMETKKPLAWVGILATLILYGESLNASRILAHGWRMPPRTPDYVGIVGSAIVPALVCFAVGVWWTRRSGRPKLAAT
jgi:hypothetical protein